VQALTGLGIGETISSVADRIFSIAKEAGQIGYDAFKKVWPVLSDPKKGVPLAILAIKAVEYFAPDPNFGIDQLSNFADWLQSYDPSKILGPQPQMFYVNWNQINQWIPDEQCGWGDILCGTRNALRALARGLIGGFEAIGSLIYWELWNLAYYLIKGLLYLGAFLIKYLIIPIGKALTAIIANCVHDHQEGVLCVYTICSAHNDDIPRRKRSGYREEAVYGARCSCRRCASRGSGGPGLRVRFSVAHICPIHSLTDTATHIHAASSISLHLRLLHDVRLCLCCAHA